MAYCQQCGNEVADVKFCSNCGAPTPSGSASASGEAARPERGTQTDPRNGSSVDENLMAALSYFVITAVIFLLVEPYKQNKFIRFHCFQAIFYWLATLVVWFAVGIVGSMFGFFAISLTPLVGVGLFIVWILLLVKAFQGERFKLPIIGELAEQQT